MRILLITLFSLSLFGCFQQKTLQPGELITSENADLVTSFDTNNIESMVTYYFASRVRGDDKWREVLQDSSKWSDRMRHSIIAHNSWKFVEFKNLGFYKGTYDNYVKVFFKIEVNGETSQGEDDVELGEANGHMIITKVPI